MDLDIDLNFYFIRKDLVWFVKTIWAENIFKKLENIGLKSHNI